MPEQPVNHAEERLQRYARERRERGGDFPLHPATRRLLQGEVARQFGAGAVRASRGGIVAWFSAWRTFSISCALVALLGVGVWMVSREMEPLGDSRNEFAKAEAPDRRTAAEFEARKLDDSLDKVSRSIAPELGANKPAAPMPAPLMAPGVALREEKEKVAKDLDSAPGKERLATVRSTLATSSAPAEPRGDAVLVRKMEFASVQNESLNAARRPAPAVANSSLSGALEGTASGNSRFINPQATATSAPESLALNDSTAQGGARANAMNRSAGRPPARGGAQQLAEVSGGENLRQEFKQQGFGGAQKDNRDGTTTLAKNSYFNQQPPALAGAAAQNQIQNSPQPDAQRRYVANDTLAARQSGLSSGTVGAAREIPSPSPAVLTRFSIEQIGNLMRLTDADGSLYEGSFTSDEASVAEDRTVTTKGAALAAMRMKREIAAPRRLAFRVTGTNRTLNQMVVVNGTFVSSASAPAAGAFAEQSADKKVQDRGTAAQVMPAAPSIPAMTSANTLRASPSEQPATSAASNIVSSIEGTVRIGTSAERPFNAVRVR